MLIEANDSSLTSWVPVGAQSNFSIQNLPFGIFRHLDKKPCVGVAIGDYVLDMFELNRNNFLQEFNLSDTVFENNYLNDLIKVGKLKTRELRNAISRILRNDNLLLKEKPDVFEKYLLPQKDVQLLRPVSIGNYTDFYSSIAHATNVGKMFRPDNPLLPNWKHLPVAYHGRASSIIASGQNFHRPKGQIQLNENENPVFEATRQLDFELEMAFITSDGKPLGQSISTHEADDYIFGMVIFNDWSARDIQRWEYVPLGPFLAKNFASSISPWVVTLDALEPFRVMGEEQIPEVLPYLRYSGKKNIDINLEVFIQPENAEALRVCKSNYSNLYWNMNQQLAHHTINGCNICAGDIYASGTISGPEPDSFGSMLELTWRGTKPIKLADGSERKFINDNDTVIMKAWSEKNGVRVGFGEVKGKVLKAIG